MRNSLESEGILRFSLDMTVSIFRLLEHDEKFVEMEQVGLKVVRLYFRLSHWYFRSEPDSVQPKDVQESCQGQLEL